MAGYNSDGVWEDDDNAGEDAAQYNQRITELDDSSREDSYVRYLSNDLGIDQEQLESLGLTDSANTGSDARLYRPVSDFGLGNISPGSSVESPGLIGSALSGAGSWIKDNKELASMIGSGIVGAVKDKNAREMSQAQIDYYKQRQADLNNSVKSYTRNPNQKV